MGIIRRHWDALFARFAKAVGLQPFTEDVSVSHSTAAPSYQTTPEVQLARASTADAYVAEPLSQAIVQGEFPCPFLFSALISPSHSIIDNFPYFPSRNIPA